MINLIKKIFGKPVINAKCPSQKKVSKQPKLTILSDGTKEYRMNGLLHREDGPAIEYANGDKFWYINGKCHREDGPAVEYANGSKYWYLNGKLHREDGPAVEVYGDKIGISMVSSIEKMVLPLNALMVLKNGG